MAVVPKVVLPKLSDATAQVAASHVADIVAAEVFEIPSLLRKGYGSVAGAPAASKELFVELLVVRDVAMPEVGGCWRHSLRRIVLTIFPSAPLVCS